MSLVEDFETTIKVIVVGNGGVGKSSMIRRFCTGEYTDKYKKTIGVDFLEKEAYVSSVDQSITFMVWDTAGQEEFNAVTKQYYRNANGCVLAFSSVDRDSFDAVKSWKKKVEDECGPVAMVLVQNKVDLIDKAVVTKDEVENLAKELQVKLYRTCVSENLNVDKVFEFLGEEYVKSSKGGESGGSGLTPIATVATAGTTGSKKEAAGAGGGVGRESKTSKAGGQADAPPTKASKEVKKDVVVIDAKPKQRTGGKKKFSCVIL